MGDLFLILAVIIPTVFFSVSWILRTPLPATGSAPDAAAEILFKNGLVEHASDSALEQFPISIGSYDWSDLDLVFQKEFPDFPATAPRPRSPDITLISQISDDRRLRLTWQKDSLLLLLEETRGATPNATDQTKDSLLHQIAVNTPQPTWVVDHDGRIIWSNQRYSTLRERWRVNAKDPDGPVFDLTGFEGVSNGIKVSVLVDNIPEWFEVSRSRIDHGYVYTASCLDALIKAEDARRDFVQTLSKTFAHLSIGLAIFNRDRQLALFNPALTDLTGLSASFLSPRPTIDTFFDALRENRRMPEPKNYNTWRHRMAELICAAEVGRFEETWTLETGQTYKIKGRPHPDGAIAFLIEDISAEISLTRNFRAELELGQSLADTFEDALATFSQSGIMTFSNKAYDLLWGFEFDSGFAEVTIADAIRLWKEKSTPNPLWQDVQDAVMSLQNRKEWEMAVTMKGQCKMLCRIVPIASGATVVRFSHIPAKESAKAQMHEAL